MGCFVMYWVGDWEDTLVQSQDDLVRRPSDVDEFGCSLLDFFRNAVVARRRDGVGLVLDGRSGFGGWVGHGA